MASFVEKCICGASISVPQWASGGQRHVDWILDHSNCVDRVQESWPEVPEKKRRRKSGK